MKSKQVIMRASFLQDKYQSAANQCLELLLDRMDYPDFSPDHAEKITHQMLAQGRLAIAPEGIRGLCV